MVVVVNAPGFDLLPRVVERDELMHVQALVLGGLSRSYATSASPIAASASVFCGFQNGGSTSAVDVAFTIVVLN